MARRRGREEKNVGHSLEGWIKHERINSVSYLVSTYEWQKKK